MWGVLFRSENDKIWLLAWMAAQASPPTDFGSRSKALIQILTILAKLLLNTSLAVTSKIIPFQASFPSKIFSFYIFCLYVSSSTDKSVLEEEKSWRSDEKFSFHHQYCLPLTFHLAIVPDEESVWVWRNMLNETVLTRTIYDRCYKACCVGLPCALTFFGMLWHGILLCHSVWYGTLCTVLCWQVAFS